MRPIVFDGIAVRGDPNARLTRATSTATKLRAGARGIRYLHEQLADLDDAILFYLPVHLIPPMRNSNAIGMVHQKPKNAAFGHFVSQPFEIRADRRCESPAGLINRV